jgi:phosphate starvation-inducible membrane PsiE
MQYVENFQYGHLLNKYLKCNVWRLAVRYVIYIYVVSRLRVNIIKKYLIDRTCSRQMGTKTTSKSLDKEIK